MAVRCAPAAPALSRAELFWFKLPPRTFTAEPFGMTSEPSRLKVPALIVVALFAGTFNETVTDSKTSTLYISGYGNDTDNRFSGSLDQFRVYNGEPSAAEVAALYAETHACTGASANTLHHLEIHHASGSGLTCSPDTVTVVACQDAICLQPYTTGVIGTLAASGSAMVMNWPDGAGFAIPAGSSSGTLRLQQTTVGSSVLSVSSSTPSASSAATCNFGSPSCTWTAADAGFLFDVPSHVSELTFALENLFRRLGAQFDKPIKSLYNCGNVTGDTVGQFFNFGFCHGLHAPDRCG